MQDLQLLTEEDRKQFQKLEDDLNRETEIFDEVARCYMLADQENNDLEKQRLEPIMANGRAQHADLRDKMKRVRLLKEIEDTFNKHKTSIEISQEMVKSVTDVSPQVIAPFLAPVLDAVLDLADHLEPQLDRGRIAQACEMRKKFKALIEAGFTEEQALSLVASLPQPDTAHQLITSITNVILSSSSVSLEAIVAIVQRVKKNR